jgi:hypothetical protein
MTVTERENTNKRLAMASVERGIVSEKLCLILTSSTEKQRLSYVQ